MANFVCKFWSEFLKMVEIFWEILVWKIEIFLGNSLQENIKIFWKFVWKIEFFLDPDPRPPRFQTRLTPLGSSAPKLCKGHFRSSSITLRTCMLCRPN